MLKCAVFFYRPFLTYYQYIQYFKGNSNFRISVCPQLQFSLPRAPRELDFLHCNAPPNLEGVENYFDYIVWCKMYIISALLFLGLFVFSWWGAWAGSSV